VRRLRLYIQPVILGAVFFVTAIAVYAAVWNLVIAYNVFPSTPVSASGMVTVTTFLLTTSTFITNQTTTTESTTTRTQNQTATTVLNETVTATMCPAGVTSCTGTGESVAVVVNRPVVLIGNLRIGQIPIYNSAMTPPSLEFYHNTYYAAVGVICAAYITTSILSGRRKVKTQNQRRLNR
jgi:hypothetical protein